MEQEAQTARYTFSIAEQPTVSSLFADLCAPIVAVAATPNEWFCFEFPEQAQAYGPAAFEKAYRSPEGEKRVEPIALNEDFFAGLLGGSHELGHEVVFFEPDQTFYFFDPRTGFYHETSEGKLELLLSRYFLRCAQQMPSNVDLMNLVEKFRTAETLHQIVRRARSLLAADESFFAPESGKVRETGPERFAKFARVFLNEKIRRDIAGTLRVTDASEAFRSFCLEKGWPTMDRKHFKPMFLEIVDVEFRLRVRNDILDGNGRQQEGWKGICVPNLSSG